MGCSSDGQTRRWLRRREAQPGHRLGDQVIGLGLTAQVGPQSHPTHLDRQPLRLGARGVVWIATRAPSAAKARTTAVPIPRRLR